jgi:hypothetical protein
VKRWYANIIKPYWGFCSLLPRQAQRWRVRELYCQASYKRPLLVQVENSKSCLILSSSRYKGTWTVVRLTAAKFKHLSFGIQNLSWGFRCVSESRVICVQVLQLYTELIALPPNATRIKCYDSQMLRRSPLHSLGTYLAENIVSHSSFNDAWRICCLENVFIVLLSSNVCRFCVQAGIADLGKAFIARQRAVNTLPR